VRRHPGSGRKALYLSAHASHIEGWPVADGRLLLYDLNLHATGPEFVYRHAWREGDLVIWDNRDTCIAAGRTTIPGRAICAGRRRSRPARPAAPEPRLQSPADRFGMAIWRPAQSGRGSAACAAAARTTPARASGRNGTTRRRVRSIDRNINSCVAERTPSAPRNISCARWMRFASAPRIRLATRTLSPTSNSHS
jgi:hypothetical protein